MAMIKCRECGNEMSDHAKMCPNCGVENNIMFCPACDKQLSLKASMCPNCGYTCKNSSQGNSKGNMFGLSIAAFVCSFFYIAGIIGLIFGIIVLNANKGLKNTARSFSIAAIAISSVELFFIIIGVLIGASL